MAAFLETPPVGSIVVTGLAPTIQPIIPATAELRFFGLTASPPIAVVTTGDPHFYQLAYGTDFEDEQIWNQYNGEWDEFGPYDKTTGSNYLRIPNKASLQGWANNQSFEIQHTGGATYAKNIDKAEAYTGTQSCRINPGEKFYIDSSLPSMFFGPGMSSTVQVAIKLRVLPALGEQLCFAGDWGTDSGTDYKSIFWGVECTSANTYKFLFMYDRAVYDGSGNTTGNPGQGDNVESVYSAALTGIFLDKWNLYRVAIDSRQQEVSFFINDALFEKLTLSSDIINLDNYSTWYTGIGCGGVNAVSENTIDGWVDVIKTYAQVAILEAFSSDCNERAVIPLNYSPPISSEGRKFISLEIANGLIAGSYWTKVNGFSWYDWGIHRIDDEKAPPWISLYYDIPFHEKAGSNSFGANGYVSSTYWNTLASYSSNAIIGSPAVGEPPLTANGVRAVKFTSTTGQAYTTTGNYSFENQYFYFVLKHDGTPVVRTLVMGGDLYGSNSLDYFVELTTDNKVRCSDSNSSATTTTTVPVDTLSTIIIDLAHSNDLRVSINGGAFETLISSADVTGAGASSYIGFTTIGAKLNSNNFTLQNDEFDDKRWVLETCTFSESAVGVTFENFSVMSENGQDSGTTYATMDDVAAAYHSLIINSPYVDPRESPEANLFSDLRLQGTSTNSNVIDMIGNLTWTMNNALYTPDQSTGTNITSAAFNPGIPIDNAGYIECNNTSSLTDAIGTGPFCIEVWAMVRERGLTSPFGGTSSGDTLQTQLNKAWFGLLDIASAGSESTSRTPYFAVVANGTDNPVPTARQMRVRAYDETRQILANGSDPTIDLNLEVMKYKADIFQHIAFVRVIETPDSYYILFVDGYPIHWVEMTGIIDFSALDCIFRYGTPWDTTAPVDSAPWFYYSGAKIWTESKYTAEFVPKPFDNGNAYSRCTMIESHGVTLYVGDVWIDTDDNGKKYIWDGEEWVAA